ncbi:MAG: hypothetical protein M3Y48_21715 [Actinomycetota bacterium]|nr:hypothetical protein [Actinomycetota bacterium]
MIPAPRYRVDAPGRSVEMAGACPADRVLTPAEALVEFFLTNADRGRNAENDVFVEELLRRRRAIQSLTNPAGR